MDWNYSTETKDVYHALLTCPDALDIKKEHHVYQKPPADENRRACIECLRLITDWLATLQPK
jgi:hypothetical protein